MKTSDLTGAALDWSVAKALGEFEWNLEIDRFRQLQAEEDRLRYSTDWAQGGPIVEHEKIELEHATAIYGLPVRWVAAIAGYCAESGPTPLVAAMRCYVASKLGDEVDVPKELL